MQLLLLVSHLAVSAQVFVCRTTMKCSKSYGCIDVVAHYTPNFRFVNFHLIHLAHRANDDVQTVIMAPPMETQFVSRIWRLVSFLLCTNLLIRTMQSRVLPGLMPPETIEVSFLDVPIWHKDGANLFTNHFAGEVSRIHLLR